MVQMEHRQGGGLRQLGDMAGRLILIEQICSAVSVNFVRLAEAQISLAPATVCLSVRPSPRRSPLPPV